MGGATKLDSGRVYVIGPVHGCFDLLQRLMAQIRADVTTRPARPTRLVLLGGIVDHGRQSAEVVRRLRHLSSQTRDVIVLKGSGEQMMVQALGGDLDKLEAWLCRGGSATLESWGVPRATLEGPLPALLRAARGAVGGATLRWMAALPTWWREGDHLFAHAGVRPGIPLDAQSEDDLLWIGHEFLDHDGDVGAVVVHSQTRQPEPDLTPRRIGLPDGVWWSGYLKAVGLEGGERWLVAA